MHILPQLSYAYDALEPHIDAKTMEIHHTKHHQTYVDKLNAALEKYPDFQNQTAEELLRNIEQVPDEIKKAVQNHGGGHSNHSIFWTIIGPADPSGAGTPAGASGKLVEDIAAKFGSFDEFTKKFNEVATNHFGSGWAWLAYGQEEGLHIHALPNQDSPYMHKHVPIMGLDVWEHAYYLKYQNKRPDYIAAFWNVINWKEVEKRYEEAVK